MTQIRGWQWIPALLLGLIFFVVFSAGYGLLVYLRPERFISRITPKDLGVSYRDVTFKTADGLALSSWFVPALGETKQAVLLLHGYPADKGDILESMIFLRKEYNLLFLDFRYFGQSEGSYSTIGIKETADVLAAVKYLKSMGMEKIGVWGFSMGGATALMTLPETSDIAAVAADTSYASLELMAAEVYRQVPGLNKLIAAAMSAAAKIFLKIDIRKQSPRKAVETSQVPMLFIHSRDDEVIPFGQAELLQQAATHNPSAEFWFRESLGHGYLGSEEYQQRIKDFFARYL